jgi:hypothetical protein
MNFGQRYLELATSYVQDSSTGLVTLNVAQMPPNANLVVPGPAMIFLVVDGIPSIGQVSLPSLPPTTACARYSRSDADETHIRVDGHNRKWSY